MTIVGRTVASGATLTAVSAAAALLAVAGGSGNFPLGFVNREYTGPLLLQLLLIWVAAAVVLASVVAAVRVEGGRRVVTFRAARRVGFSLVILLVLWMLLLGFLAMIGGGAVLALLVTLAATGPALLLAVGLFSQGAIRNAWAALVPPLGVLLLSGTATAFSVLVGVTS